MLAAYAAGAAAIRALSASLWNPDGLANVLRAIPFLPLVPTGGIGVENAAAWLAAGSTGGQSRGQKPPCNTGRNS
jgi:2-dehydro-3-deoxyphosphogluconate aldolase/(4S)-4-hydroxy-2-oxoglutarate aldolase